MTNPARQAAERNKMTDDQIYNIANEAAMEIVRGRATNVTQVIKSAIDAATAELTRERDAFEQTAERLSELCQVTRRERDEAREAAPAWHARPTSPGWWVVFTEKQPPFEWAQSCMYLDDDDLKRGAPFGAVSVYGPIPAEPPEMPT